MLIHVQGKLQHSLSEQARVMTLEIMDLFEVAGKLACRFI